MLAGDEAVDTGTEIGVHDRDVMNDETGSFIGGVAPLNIDHDLMTADGVLEAGELNLALINVRATRRFTGGDGTPTTASPDPLVAAVTLMLLKLVKEAIHDLFQQHHGEVQRSWGSMLDQEEAVGYLVCDALALDILPGEARTIGKKAVKLHKKAKEADDKLKGLAAARRKRAREAAAKDETLAEQLDEKIAAIDKEIGEQRLAPWATVVDLNLPTTRLVPTRQRAPDRAPPPRQTERRQPTPLEAAEGELAAAEAAKAAAELRLRQAERALVKLQPPAFGGEKLTTKSWSYFFFHPLEMPEEEQQRRKELFDALFAGEWAVRSAQLEIDCAARDITSAQDQVDLERKILELDREAAAQAAAQQQRLAAQQLERERERERAAAEDEAAEARAREADQAEIEELKRRLAKERAEVEQQIRESEREVARSQWYWSRSEVVQQHARKVWGAGSEQENRPPPKVFSLVGKSADEVRSLACDVSQTVTDTEERVRLNRVQHEMLH